jgi:hypothetical protein
LPIHVFAVAIVALDYVALAERTKILYFILIIYMIELKDAIAQSRSRGPARHFSS